jgi:hypothetical protein
LSVNQESFFEFVLRALERIGVPYMIAGSVAAMLYGEPRLTNDMDVVAELAPDHIEPLLAQFQTDEYYVPSPAFVRSIVANGGAFNVIHVPSASKVDLIIRRRNDFATVEFSRRRSLPFTDGFDAFVATPEDVILSKLLFYREGRSEKHLTDIAGVLRVSAGQIDESYIESWVQRLGLVDGWLESKRRAEDGR